MPYFLKYFPHSKTPCCQDTEGHTSQLALGAGQYLAHSLCGSSRAGNNITRRGTSSTPVLPRVMTSSQKKNNANTLDGCGTSMTLANSK